MVLYNKRGLLWYVTCCGTISKFHREGCRPQTPSAIQPLHSSLTKNTSFLVNIGTPRGIRYNMRRLWKFKVLLKKIYFCNKKYVIIICIYLLACICCKLFIINNVVRVKLILFDHLTCHCSFKFIISYNFIKLLPRL